jgi:hypothetical protein
MNPPQGQGEKTLGSRERPPSSPQEGESSHNRYIGLPTKGNMDDLRDRQEENEKKNTRRNRRGNQKRKRKINPGNKWGNHNKISSKSSPIAPYFFKRRKTGNF